MSSRQPQYPNRATKRPLTWTQLLRGNERQEAQFNAFLAISAKLPGKVVFAEPQPAVIDAIKVYALICRSLGTEYHYDTLNEAWIAQAAMREQRVNGYIVEKWV